jgi:hypothetical protein
MSCGSARGWRYSQIAICSSLGIDGVGAISEEVTVGCELCDGVHGLLHSAVHLDPNFAKVVVDGC